VEELAASLERLGRALELNKVTIACKILDLLSKDKELDEKIIEIFSELFNKISSQIKYSKVKMHYAKMFYPLIALLTAILLLIVVLAFRITFDLSRLIGVFAFGYNLAYLISLLFDDDVIMRRVLRIKREETTNTDYYADIKASLKFGKSINQKFAAVVALLALLVLIFGG